MMNHIQGKWMIKLRHNKIVLYLNRSNAKTDSLYSLSKTKNEMVEPCMTLRLQAETWKFCSGRARELAEDPNIQIKWRNGQCLLTMIGTVAYIQKLLPEWWKHVRIYSTSCKKYWTSYTRLKKICWPEWITNLMVHCKNGWGKN